ncbi:YlxR family protein, partial [Micrococcus endophyticus]
HPGRDCLLLALRRRAFGRAFRSAVDAEGLRREPETPADRPTDEGGSEI